MKKIVIVVIVAVLVLAAVVGFEFLRRQNEGSNVLNTANHISSGTVESSGNVTLNITSPLNNESINTSQVSVVGTTVPGGEVSVNEADMVADSKGNFSAVVNLDEGSNTISVVANDSNGNFIEKDITVTYTPAQ